MQSWLAPTPPSTPRSKVERKTPTPVAALSLPPNVSTLLTKRKGNAENNSNKARQPAPKRRRLDAASLEQKLSACVPGSLTGLTFVLSGTLESLEREPARQLIQQHGGKVTMQISGKTDYLVAGSKCGPSIMSKATEKATKVIDEAKLFNLLQTRKPPEDKKKKNTTSNSNSNTSVAPPRAKLKTTAPMMMMVSPTNSNSSSPAAADTLWVDKYEPRSIDELVGNQENIRRIREFLTGFVAAASITKKKSQQPRRAICLVGPPGTGKSTAASLISRACGFEPLEFNASSVRNKSSIDRLLAPVTASGQFASFLKRVVIMDEVDGMTGNENRGGMQALIKLIHATSTPIICIANDAHHPQMRTLKNHVTVLTWKRLTVQQVLPRIGAICKAESITLGTTVLQKLMEVAHGDLRSVINTLELQSKTNDSKSIGCDSSSSSSKKDIELGPFDVASHFFIQPRRNEADYWIDDRINDYFVDSDLMPLFVHQNYLSCCDRDGLDAMSLAADSISDGDLIDRQVWQGEDFSLMPLHAVSSCIAPAVWAVGRDARRWSSATTQFPGFLGQHSKRSGNLRRIRELQMKTLHSVDTLVTEYLPQLRRQTLQQLLKEDKQPPSKDDVEKVVKLLGEYLITGDDLKTIWELTETFDPASRTKDIAPTVRSGITKRLNAQTSGRRTEKGCKGVLKAQDVKRDTIGESESGDDEEENGEGDEPELPKPRSTSTPKSKPAHKMKTGKS